MYNLYNAMGTIPDKLKHEIETLYQTGSTMKQIAEKFGYSINHVYYFMRKHKIARRDLKTSAYVRFTNKASSFKVNTNLTPEQEKLKLLGTSLYWAEGYKTDKSAGIDFANSDTTMVLIFLRFLREICQVDESRIRVLLYTHEGHRVGYQVRYWSSLLSIPIENFSKPYIAKSSMGVEKKSKMPYGLVHLRYADKKLLWLVLEWIEELKENS